MAAEAGGESPTHSSAQEGEYWGHCVLDPARPANEKHGNGGRIRSLWHGAWWGDSFGIVHAALPLISVLLFLMVTLNPPTPHPNRDNN